MDQGRIIVITGSPGTGKSTIASLIARKSDKNKSVHMRTDDFYHYLSKGAIPPYLPESNEQNRVVIEAFLEAAKRFARGGYDVIVDGIIGPWFIEPLQNLVREHVEVHYIILRADKEETLKRAVSRTKLNRKTNMELVETMWKQFCSLGKYESHVIDTTSSSIEETVCAVRKKIAGGTALLSQA
jgi:broad-specificity NMP kinase